MGTTFSLLPIAYRLLPYTLRLAPFIACPPSLFIFAHDFRRIIKTRREGESLPLSSPSRPSSVNQSKFIHLLKSEGASLS